MIYRLGQGYDVHPFVEGRPLVLGGVVVPYRRGLGGHSDADVLLHAICDALLGAAGLGDLGRHFPSSDPALAGVSSLRLLEEVWSRVRAGGWRIANLDATIIAQEPSLAPYFEAMRRSAAQALGLEIEAVNVKATTTDGLGAIGRGEGIAASAIVLLYRDERGD